MGKDVSGVDLRVLEAFLYEEADYLDSGNLDAWISLYTEDATYWMPVSEEQQDPLGEISILYENRTLMQIRALNFNHRLAPSFETPVKTSHIIGNVRLLECDSLADITVRSNFHLVMFFQGVQEIFAGRATHHLQIQGEAGGSGFLIRHKRVDLIDSAAPHKSIPIYF